MEQADAERQRTIPSYIVSGTLNTKVERSHEFVRHGGQTNRGPNDNVHPTLSLVLELVIDWEKLICQTRPHPFFARLTF